MKQTLNRRAFIMTAVKLAVVTTGVMSTSACFNYFETADERLKRLLSKFYKSHFKTLARDKNIEQLRSSLLELKVIDAEGNIHSDVVKKLAKGEGLITHNGFYYTETEVKLYALAYLYSHVI